MHGQVILRVDTSSDEPKQRALTAGRKFCEYVHITHNQPQKQRSHYDLVVFATFSGKDVT